MKARIKATGYIIEVYHDPKNPDLMIGESGLHYDKKILEIIDDFDYWTRLEHTYAGMAMQGILAHEGTEFRNYLPQEAKDIAHALVEKLKEKEERK